MTVHSRAERAFLRALLTVGTVCAIGILSAPAGTGALRLISICTAVALIVSTLSVIQSIVLEQEEQEPDEISQLRELYVEGELSLLEFESRLSEELQ